ncbi:MAG: hypothetical protein DRN21_01490 [Thermoplasmata archaeon]|nr:MAG: hypothetical protein DRN21_01490 [Thermoplasmata archaeon]
MMWIALGVVCIIMLIILSAFFAAAEMAFVSADRVRIRDEALRGNKNAHLLEQLIEHSDEVVSAIVVGNNLVNITASTLAGAMATHVFGSVGVGIATAVMTFLVVIFGEATPKAYGINNEEFALRMARYLFLIKKIFYPAASGFSKLSMFLISLTGKRQRRKASFTENEVKAMLDLGVENGTIEKDEKELVEEVFDFDETKAMEVFVPREQVVSLSEDDTVGDLIETSVKTGYSRFPLRRENIDDIVGMVHVKDALNRDRNTPLREIEREIIKISPKMKVDDVLREMQQRKIHMAVLQSKEGRTIGLLTLEDLIEEIFGEIKDEHDIK